MTERMRIFRIAFVARICRSAGRGLVAREDSTKWRSRVRQALPWPSDPRFHVRDLRCRWLVATVPSPLPAPSSKWSKALGRTSKSSIQSPSHAFHFDEVFIVRNQHDGIAQRDSKQSYEANE